LVGQGSTSLQNRNRLLSYQTVVMAEQLRDRAPESQSRFAQAEGGVTKERLRSHPRRSPPKRPQTCYKFGMGGLCSCVKVKHKVRIGGLRVESCAIGLQGVRIGSTMLLPLCPNIGKRGSRINPPLRLNEPHRPAVHLGADHTSFFACSNSLYNTSGSV
jgi:hypothetical protein